MKLTRDFLYTAKKPVLLLCDYYDTPHIPSEMLEIKDNIALFPIANIPIIEIILSSLLKQKFKNIIIAGTKINNVVEHIFKTDYINKMDIRIFQSKGNSLGDLFREFYSNEFEFNNLLVMYANNFTNISLKELYKKHLSNKKSLLTIFSHKKDSNDLKTSIYGTVGNRLIFYEETKNEKVDFSSMNEKIYKEMSIQIDTSLVSPRVMYVSKEIFSVFHSNFDYHTFGDLIIGTLAMNIWDDVFWIFKEKDFWEEQEKTEEKIGICFYDVLVMVQVNDSFVYTESGGTRWSTSSYDADKNKCKKKDNSFYGKEIATLLDYYKFNMYVWENPQIVNLDREILQIKERTGNNKIEIYESFVGEKALVEANIENCIVWDNCRVKEKANQIIFVSENHFFDINYLETVHFLEIAETTPNSENFKKTETFFDDLRDYLFGLITTTKVYSFDQADIHKQISLLRILRNASDKEVIEAFAYFLIDIVDLDNLEDSLSQISKIFFILNYYIIQKSDQQLLLDVMLDCLSIHSHDIRVQIFFNYGYLFVQYKIIDKAILKKYTNLYKAGKL